MLSRRRQKLSSFIALGAMLLAALLPASSSLARATLFAHESLVMGVICTTHDANSPVPASPNVAHGHCALCGGAASGVLVPAPIAAHAVIAVPDSAPVPPRAHAPPRENVAVHPLSPRAPPRAA